MYSTYNPFQAALSAAYHELTSENAQRYYAIKAQKDIQNTLDTTITLFAWVYQIAELTYSLYVQSRTWSESDCTCDLTSKLPSTDKGAISSHPELKGESTFEVISDFWAEPISCTYTTTGATQSGNPPITYLPLPQQPLLMLVTGAEPVIPTAQKQSKKAATTNKPRTTTKTANAQPKAKAKAAAGKTTPRRSPLKET